MNRPKPPVGKDEVIMEAPTVEEVAEQVPQVEKKATLKSKKKKATPKVKGGVLSPKTPDELALEEQKQADLKVSKERIKKLNQSAKFMLACLEPSFAADWEQAAKEQRVKDIGVYVLGVLNRLSKMVDYMESDIEPEWDQGLVGYNEHLFCDYCKKEIEITKETHLKQRFCNNLCAKRYNDAHITGIIYPTTPHRPSEEEIDEKGWQREAKREGVIA
jgi:hypothetical protein